MDCQKQLSVLIPTYNHVCYSLVKQLLVLLQHEQVTYEVIVADDGSTDHASVEQNRAISSLPGCHYIVRDKNSGRAAIRNFLVKEARYPYVLFVDSDMTVVSDQFIRRYLHTESEGVVDGGVAIMGDPQLLKGNLRYRYEKAEEPKHTAVQRQRVPYQHLHTANLLMRRDLIHRHPFDERIRHYGYEDVLLGKVLHQNHVPILHIDNPLGFSTFESNADFLDKTEEGLRTLWQYQKELRGYSRLLTFVSGIHIPAILSLFRLYHRLFGKLERHILCSAHPSLLLFKLYRLGYFLCLK